MNEPTLCIMAAGMGSRYGGLKQIDPLNDHGNIIIDYSIYDALNAGFKKIVFIIKKAIEADFKEIIGDRISKLCDVKYVCQEVDSLPTGFDIPVGRTKPWGTGHAILACKDAVDGAFAVINADDYYGANAFNILYSALKNLNDDEKFHYTMIGYVLENTLTEHGHVARGVCTADQNNMLLDIVERVHIEKTATGAKYTEDSENWVDVDPKSIVSMNMWGFTPSIFSELEQRFSKFLEANLQTNPIKCEFFLPTVVDELLKANMADVKVHQSFDKWYGVTYREDKEVVANAIKELTFKKVYPENLWEVAK